MEHVSERLREPLGGLDETVFGPIPAGGIRWALLDEFEKVMDDWAAGIPAAAKFPIPAPAQCVPVLREHSHTDPDTGVTKHDYITREMRKEGIT